MSSEIVPFVDGSDTIPSVEPDRTGEKGKAAMVVSGGNHDMRNMTSEIVPFVDGSDATSPVEPDCTGKKGKRFNAMEEGVRHFDLLSLRPLERPKIEFDLIGGNRDFIYFPCVEKGSKCATRLNPTPEYVKSLLDSVKVPSVLLLRGCDQLFLPLASPFPFEKFKTLISLEISGITHLTTFPENTISEMTQLQSLNLSHLPIQDLPDDFFSKLTKLCSLILKDCSNLLSHPKLPQLIALEYLELSYLLIETLPHGFFSNFEMLQRLILRGCSKLRSLPSILPLKGLEVLDLSRCTTLQEMEPLKDLPQGMLDLSYTALHFTSTTIRHHLFVTHLFLRDAKVINFEGVGLISIKVLDVSGAQIVEGLDELKACNELVALYLSRTGIESIDFISGLVDLRYLILKDCTRLRKLPSMEKLTKLEVLDISRTLVDEVPNLSNLINLKQFFFADCPKLKGVPEGLRTLTNLETLDRAPPGSSEINFIEDTRHRLQGRRPKPDEFHLVSTFFGDSGFDPFRRDFDEIVGDVSKFQENFKPTTSSVDNILTAMIDADNNRAVKRHYRGMVADLEYIRDNIGLLESCPNRTNVEELLADLTIYEDTIPSTFRYNVIKSSFQLNSNNFDEVFRSFAKLKLMVPPKQVDDLKKKKKKKSFKREGYEQRDISNINMEVIQNLSHSYDSLTSIQKKCLLYFTIFETTSDIKERALIHLWYGEGYIDLQHEENVAALSKADSTTNPQPTPKQNLNPNPEIRSISTEAGQTRNDANRVMLQVSTAKRVEPAHIIEEIGREILMVLEEKKFIYRYRESRLWRMDWGTHCFVRARAKEEGLFNIDENNGKLIPHLRLGSQRACLVLPEDNLPSYCRLWTNYTNSSEKLERLKNIRTLLNVNDHMIDIRAEWFSKMRNLSVLQLCCGSFLEDKTVEAVNFEFLEELKNMKQLRVLNMEGFSTIKKLPDSICKVTSLRILNLRECSYLEELPVGIGSLKNLTHLDLTDCCILRNLPKGIRQLSKLEVLKGFVITYQIGGQQHPNACNLRELLKLEKLRKLALVVHTYKFPDSQDLHVFNGMKNLCNLQITWQKDFNDLGPQPQGVVVGRKASTQYSRWVPLKCWEQQTRQNETEELLGSNLKKLVLCCFPLETAPDWLHPSGLQKLEKLYILGGKLKTLVGDTDQNTWNVKTLVLTYLPEMYMDSEELRSNFPHMTHLEAYGCDRLPTMRGELKRVGCQDFEHLKF